MIADEKAQLLTDVMYAISEIGVKLVNIVFDGLSTNLPACEKLGASFNLNNMQPYVNNPYDGSRVYVLFDACHAIKLFRNCFASRTMFDGNGNKIQWKFIEKLVRYQEDRNFVTSKLTKRHIQWKGAIMNVKLATQTLSNSVYNSMIFLKEQGCSDFIECGATATFAKHSNDLFDIFNSTSKVSNDSTNIFKNVLSEENKTTVFSKLNEIDTYIRSLKLSFNQSILISEKKAGFLGFLINIASLKAIQYTYITTILKQRSFHSLQREK